MSELEEGEVTTSEDESKPTTNKKSDIESGEITDSETTVAINYDNEDVSAFKHELNKKKNQFIKPKFT